MKANRTAFSLVELSIVLVILGLLVGGILAGQSLIRASELRAVSTEQSRWTTAVNAFRDKYFGLPGDIANATSFWGQSSACSGSVAAGVCNGSADGYIHPAAAASQTGETFQFWRQLSSAGLIEGTYSGISGTTIFSEAILGTNVPVSKVSGAGWSVRSYVPGNYPGNSPASDYGNVFMFGGANGNYTEYPSALATEDAWNLDVKTDDGLPNAGRTVARSICAYGSNCNCSLATVNTDFAAGYRLDWQGKSCSMYFRRAY